MHEIDQGVLTDADGARPLTRRERAVVIARSQSLIEFWGITQDELDADTPFVDITPRGPLPIKYQHPLTGETWDGQGPHPDWLRRALLKEGMRVEELRPPSLPGLTPETTAPPAAPDEGAANP